jgi:hypothetical protein
MQFDQVAFGVFHLQWWQGPYMLQIYPMAVKNNERISPGRNYAANA